MVSRQRKTKELDVARLAEVRAALDRGESCLAISERLAVHRNVVIAVRDGTHVSDRLGARAVRCDGCGHTVVMPCRICDARRYQADESPLSSVSLPRRAAVGC